MTQAIDSALYKKRRDTLAQLICDGYVVLPNAAPCIRSRDIEYPYRWDSYFFYLSGFTEPQSLLFLSIAEGRCNKAIIFCRSHDEHREIWEGPCVGLEQAVVTYAFDEACPIHQAPLYLKNIFHTSSCSLFYSFGYHHEWDQFLIREFGCMDKKCHPRLFTPEKICDIRKMVDRMRFIKDPTEIEIMKRAAAISAQGHVDAMRFVHPGCWEYEVEAQLSYTFRCLGAQGHAYRPIVASGSRTCTLHYNDNHHQIKSGDIVLVDAACELESYASDITRTYPVSGFFTKEQEEIYDIVLWAQKQAILSLHTDQTCTRYHEIAVMHITEGLISLGLLTGTLEDNIENGTYKSFYMHSTGHWIGLDVHDSDPCSAISPGEKLQPGVVLTIEPGIYIRPSENIPKNYWHIGIRIEDVAVITEQGCEVITDGVPKEKRDILAIINKKLC